MLMAAGLAVSAIGTGLGFAGSRKAAKQAEAEAAYNRAVEAWNQDVNSKVSRFNSQVLDRQEEMVKSQYAFTSGAFEKERKETVKAMHRDLSALKGEAALYSNLSGDVVKSMVSDQMAAISLTNESYIMQQEMDRFGIESELFNIASERTISDFNATVGRETSLARSNQISMQGANTASQYRSQGFSTLAQGASSMLTDYAKYQMNQPKAST